MSDFFSSDRYQKFEQSVAEQIDEQSDNEFLPQLQYLIRLNNGDPPPDYCIDETMEIKLLDNIHRILDPLTNFDDFDRMIQLALRDSGLFKSSHIVSPFFSNSRFKEFLYFLSLTDLDISQDFLDMIKDAISVIDPDPDPSYCMNEAIEAEFLTNLKQLLDSDLDHDYICSSVQKALRASDLFKSQAYRSPFFSEPRCAEFIQMMLDIFHDDVDESDDGYSFIRRLKHIFCINQPNVPNNFYMNTEVMETEFITNFWNAFFELDQNERLSVEISIALSESCIATYALIYESEDIDNDSEMECGRPCDCTCDCGCLMTKNTKSAPPQRPPPPALTSSDFTYLDSKDKLDRFLCPICLQPALDPIITTCCGEIQCRNCFIQTVEAIGFIRPTCSGHKKMICCSKCKTMINSGSVLRIPGGFKDFFDELTVQCVKCEHVCRRDQFQDHWQSPCQIDAKSH